MPKWRKLLGLFAVAYVLMPADLVPDVVPVLGWLDDLGVVSATAMWVWRDIRRHGEREAALPS